MNKKRLTKKWLWGIVLVIVAALAITTYVVSANNKNATSTDYQTQVVKKGNITAIVGGTGSVRANQSVQLTWKTTGQIDSINVGIGGKANSNDVLASLAQSSLSQSIIQAQSDLVTAQRNLDDLLNSDSAKAQAQLDLANAKEDYDKVRWNAVYADTPRETSQNTLDSASATVVIAQDRVDKAQKEYNKYGESSETDLLKANALNNLAAAKKALAEAKTSLDFYTNTPNTKEVSISQGEIAVAKAKLDDAQREWDRLKEGPDPADIEAAKARVAAIQATLDMAKIIAPFSGTITDSSGMVGDLVNNGSDAFRIDDLSHMYIEVEIPEVDINLIKTGQKVDITFDAVNNAAYSGTVTDVAQVGSEVSGSVNFKVTIELLNPDEHVLPGMTAAINILVSDIKDVLIVPNRAVRIVNDQHVVYLLQNGKPVAVEIEIGSSSDSYSEVISGSLKVGDVLILNPATDIFNSMQGPSNSGTPF
jgi:HlyD family secretion protein